MAKKKSKKVIRYRRPLNINVGMILYHIHLSGIQRLYVSEAGEDPVL